MPVRHKHFANWRDCLSRLVLAAIRFVVTGCVSRLPSLDFDDQASTYRTGAQNFRQEEKKKASGSIQGVQFPPPGSRRQTMRVIDDGKTCGQRPASPAWPVERPCSATLILYWPVNRLEPSSRVSQKEPCMVYAALKTHEPSFDPFRSRLRRIAI